MSGMLQPDDLVRGSGWSRVQPYWDDATMNAPLVEACRDMDGIWWYRELDKITGKPKFATPTGGDGEATG